MPLDLYRPSAFSQKWYELVANCLTKAMVCCTLGAFLDFVCPLGGVANLLSGLNVLALRWRSSLGARVQQCSRLDYMLRGADTDSMRYQLSQVFGSDGIYLWCTPSWGAHHFETCFALDDGVDGQALGCGLSAHRKRSGPWTSVGRWIWRPESKVARDKVRGWSATIFFHFRHSTRCRGRDSMMLPSLHVPDHLLMSPSLAHVPSLARVPVARSTALRHCGGWSRFKRAAHSFIPVISVMKWNA